MAKSAINKTGSMKHPDSITEIPERKVVE